MDREQLTVLLHRIFSRRIACSLEDVKLSAARFVLEPVVWSGSVVGVLMRDGTEVHIEVDGAVHRRWATRKFFRGVLNPIIERFGYATTVVCEGNRRGLDFCRRVGFDEIGRENGIVKMICKVTL